MTGGDVERLRSFNRAVTARVGALETEYLGRGRPLGESRLLWELDARGTEVRTLRRRLGLDAGYLSRLLRSLEAQELVVVEASSGDGRVRTARLTARGVRERRELDRLSDDLAASILEPLVEGERAALTEAARTVERLLRRSEIEIAPEDPAGADARWCIEQYFAVLAERFEGGFDPRISVAATEEDLRPPRGLLLVARRHGEPVGCGALKHRPGAVTEIKRMWVDESARGLGLGRRLLRELESRASNAGAQSVRLETNRTLTEAIALYRSAGYREVGAFNDEPYAHHWFTKRLGPARIEAMNDKVNLEAALATFDEPFAPRIIGTMNDLKLMVAKTKGEFVWHTHPDTDDLFYVVKGELTIQLRDRDVVLGPGDLYVVPRGVEHCPRSDEGAEILLVETQGTVNTGDAPDG